MLSGAITPLSWNEVNTIELERSKYGVAVENRSKEICSDIRTELQILMLDQDQKATPDSLFKRLREAHPFLFWAIPTFLSAVGVLVGTL